MKEAREFTAKRKKMNKKLGSLRIFFYICPQNVNGEK